jgi:hypothetical protein
MLDVELSRNSPAGRGEGREGRANDWGVEEEGREVLERTAAEEKNAFVLLAEAKAFLLIRVTPRLVSIIATVKELVDPDVSNSLVPRVQAEFQFPSVPNPRESLSSTCHLRPFSSPSHRITCFHPINLSVTSFFLKLNILKKNRQR